MKNKVTEKDLWSKVQAAFQDGESYAIDEAERSMAQKLVASEKCFWSIDYDHIQAYDRDYAILTTGSA